VFLRELISNAADACDKKRFLSITDSSGSDDAPEGRIRVKADKEARTLTIEDSGIGMTKEELINNLGRIAQVRALAACTLVCLKAFDALHVLDNSFLRSSFLGAKGLVVPKQSCRRDRTVPKSRTVRARMQSTVFIHHLCSRRMLPCSYFAYYCINANAPSTPPLTNTRVLNSLAQLSLWKHWARALRMM
jgi:Histidine kinase-, DNA gyrase B-, and HSP90-like ATPase